MDFFSIKTNQLFAERYWCRILRKPHGSRLYNIFQSPPLNVIGKCLFNKRLLLIVTILFCYAVKANLISGVLSVFWLN